LEKTIEAGIGVCPKVGVGSSKLCVMYWRAAMRPAMGGGAFGRQGKTFERLVAHNAAKPCRKATLGTVECKYIVLGVAEHARCSFKVCRPI